MTAVKILCWLIIASIFLSKTVATNSTLLIATIVSLIALYIADKVLK